MFSACEAAASATHDPSVPLPILFADSVFILDEGPFVSELWFQNFSFRTLVSELSFQNFGFGTLIPELSFQSFSFRALVSEL